MAAALITTERVNDLCRQLRERGAKVERDDEAGTVRALHGKDVVFMAIQKGHNQPWIARFIQNDLFEWVEKERP